ncbi:hypothetical protein CEXT_134661 [Caerostris extrusa]|uniref:Uncharacterized protein n=1 Tax=Caerostris extrusa TaxID=172846 RepID=A0AAV4XTQ2_CAEEX|nr:hypothetical protein CEXT_134661 [Caerostris extrusa]
MIQKLKLEKHFSQLVENSFTGALDTDSIDPFPKSKKEAMAFSICIPSSADHSTKPKQLEFLDKNSSPCCNSSCHVLSVFPAANETRSLPTSDLNYDSNHVIVGLHQRSFLYLDPNLRAFKRCYLDNLQSF